MGVLARTWLPAVVLLLGLGMVLAGPLVPLVFGAAYQPAVPVLAWLLARGGDVTAIPGTRYKARLDENLGALKVSLSTEDVARIDAAVPKGAAAGTRYPAGGMGGVFI
mgnify:CR=1 FL=1